MNTRWKQVDRDDTSGADDPQASLDKHYYNRHRRRSSQAEPYISEGIASNSTIKVGERENSQYSIKQNVLEQVSDYRQEYIRNMLDKKSSESVAPRPLYKQGSFRKTATVMNGVGNNVSQHGSTVRIAPQLYHPLYLTQNLQLPRDIITANSWNRAYYETNPIVRNAINLHATYPISKMNIKCEEKEVEQFFMDLADKVDLEAVIQATALEYFKIGECFVYAAFDENGGTWKSIYHHNPDFISVKQAPIPGVNSISLKPDPELQSLITSSDPAHVRIRESLDPRIVHHVLMNEYIPLDSFNISHLKNLSSPYDVRGTSIITSVWKDLIQLDKIREAKFAQADSMINPMTLFKVGSSNPDGFYPTQQELDNYREILECHDEETEVLTSDGFKKYYDVISYKTDEHEKITDVEVKPGVKIACFNSATENIEYCEPSRATIYNHDGDMYHFFNKKMDIKVTGNHRMWTQTKHLYLSPHHKTRQSYWGPWRFVEAKDIGITSGSRFRSVAKWQGKDDLQSVDVCGHSVPTEVYLDFLGWLISEGCVWTDHCDKNYTVGICQTYKKHQKEALKSIEDFAEYIEKTYSSVHRNRTNKNQNDIWSGTFSGRDLYRYFQKEIGDEDGRLKAPFKKIPRYILDLSPRLLGILLNSLISGDGTRHKKSKDGTSRVTYFTTSKQLADDVFEAAYKCGFVPTLAEREDPRPNRRLVYAICWSNGTVGSFPLVSPVSRDPRTKKQKQTFRVEKYNGKVWCFTVPTGLFVTRRHGKITIQGNSAEFDQNFKLVTHDAVTVERIGYNGGILDTNQDVQTLTDNVFMGLMIPKAVVTQEGATYASASVALDVMRQRYNNFRNMMANWLMQKIFAPIAEVRGFYKVTNKTKRLIVPEVEWNHMNLYDLDNYIGHILGLVDKKQVSLATLHRSLGLNTQSEANSVRAEMIQMAILKKEEGELQKLSLSELRALDPEKPIAEREKPPLPGVPGALPGMDAGGLPGLPGAGPMGGGGGSPMGDLGGPLGPSSPNPLSGGGGPAQNSSSPALPPGGELPGGPGPI